MEILFRQDLYSDPDTVSVSEEMSWHNISKNIGAERDSIPPQVDSAMVIRHCHGVEFWISASYADLRLGENNWQVMRPAQIQLMIPTLSRCRR